MNQSDKPQESLAILNAGIKSLLEDKGEAVLSDFKTNQQLTQQEGQGNIAINQARDIFIHQGADPESILPSLSPEEQRKAVCEFLQDVEKKSDQFKQPTDQYIPIQVTLERQGHHQVKSIRNHRKKQSEEEPKQIYALKSEREELKRQQVDWKEVKQQHKITMVLADPGMGKSTLLSMEAITAARHAQEQLLDNPESLEDIILPLPLRLSELAKSSQELIDEIPKLIHRNYCKPEQDIQGFLREKLKKGQCLLLLDALDEVPRIDNKRIDLREKLNRFVSHYPDSLIICTSRIVGYEQGFITEAKEVEIVRFNEKQIKQYINIWFSNTEEHSSDESVSASQLIRELGSQAQIKVLAQNPLLLSLICSLYQNQELILTRRCQVYEKAVEHILEKWNSKQNYIFSQRAFSKEAKMQLLEEVAYHFTCAEQKTFDADDLNQRIEDYLGGNHVHSEFKGATTHELITALSEQDGILQKLYEDRNQYQFLHYPFQEYLTAKYLVRQTKNGAKDGIELAKAHFWEDYWHETLSLMAGLMKDPLPLLENITKVKDDIFRTHLLLAGRCIAECKENFLEKPLFTKTIEQIYEFWKVYPEADFIQSIIEAIAQVCSRTAEKLRQAINHEDWYVQLSAAKAVAAIGDRDSVRYLINHKNPFAQKIAIDFLVDSADVDIVKTLIEIARNEKNTFFVQNRALLALRRIGSADAKEALSAIANDHQDVYVRVVAAEVLGELDTTTSLELLTKFLNQEDNEVLWATVNALENIGNDDEIKAIASLIHKDIIFSHPLLSTDIVNAWEKIGDIDAVKTLATVFENTGDVCGFGAMRAAEALAKIGTVDAVEALHKSIKVLSPNIDKLKDNSLIRSRYLLVINALIDALRNIGTEAAQQVLNTIISDESIGFRIKWNACLALGKLGDPDALEKIALMALQDEDTDFSKEAVEALAEIGNVDLEISDDSGNNTRTVSTVRILFKVFLSYEDKDVKLSALVALGKLGISCITKENLVAWFEEESEELDDFDITKYLAFALDSKDSSLRLGAVQALGKIGNSDPARVSFVMKTLAKALSDSEEDIRESALEALKQIGDANAVRVLAKALYDPERSIQKSAIKALEEICSNDAVDALVAVLKDEDISIRESVVEALEKINNVNKVTSDILLFKLIQLPKPVIYTADVFLFARTLAVSWYSQLIKNMRSHENKYLTSVRSPVEQIISWLPNLFNNLVLVEDDIVSMGSIVKSQREIERQKQAREWQQMKKELQDQEEISDINSFEQAPRLFYKSYLVVFVRYYEPYLTCNQFLGELDENKLREPKPKLKQQQAKKLVEIDQIKQSIGELPPTDSDSNNNSLFQQNTQSKNEQPINSPTQADIPSQISHPISSSPVSSNLSVYQETEAEERPQITTQKQKSSMQSSILNNPLFSNVTNDESTAIRTEIPQIKLILKSSHPLKGSIFESAFAQKQSEAKGTEE
ncbi:MAG: HEAT repeat domain-containing protein [Nostoc sp. DcaGUA01]|nr:HEAT repeat domain-containing protein [Nostoc sp. DcaGUA01]